MKRQSPRKGLSLMDATVTLVIVGILLVLALPVIQVAREQARAGACSDNLKNIAVALQNYHDVYKLFPAGAMHAGTRGQSERMGPSWWVGLLPFMEASHVFDKVYDTQSHVSPVPNVPFNAYGIDVLAQQRDLLAKFKPPFMRCPSSPLPITEKPTGPVFLPTYVAIAGGCDLSAESGDYVAAKGNFPHLQKPQTGDGYRNRQKGLAPHDGIMTASGMLPPCEYLGMQSCIDGTANTMIVGEQSDWLRHVNPQNATKYHGDPGWNTQGTAGTGPRDGGGFLSGTASSTRVPTAKPPENLPEPWGADCFNVTTVRYGLNRKQVQGTPPHPGVSGDHGVNNPLQSVHPGGAYVVMTDGAVLALSEKIDLAILLRLAIRDDGQNVGKPPTAALESVTVGEPPAGATGSPSSLVKPAGKPPLAPAGRVGAKLVAPQLSPLDEAIQQLNLYPRDAYLQYVALQLARRENRMEALERVTAWGMVGRRFDAERAGGVDLFSLFSGALAVQESLQLETMRGDEGRPPRARRLLGVPQTAKPPAEDRAPEAPVAIATLTGPEIESHPWEQMLGDKKPEISPLARCVPDDFYFVEFRSVAKLLDLADRGDLWGTHLFSQSQQEARSQLVGDRLKQQLAIETSDLLRPFYDLVVEEVAATGSDLYLREGSDVTVLIRFRQPAVFKAQMETFLDKVAKSQPAARRSQGECLGVPYEHVTSPDRAVHVFSAYPQPNLHVRSNSRVGLERVLAAIRGQDAKGQAVTRLGDTKEFAYIRTLMPRGAAEEDGFVYLSDPFIRRLVGPQVKLTERRRMLCYNHLRMIGHASLLYRTERGKAPESLAELAAAKCAPGEFGKDTLVCPDGGQYTLSADGAGGVCSHHGRPQYLTPCCEIPLREVSAREAEAYDEFLHAYNQFWRTFFDPIAIRLQVTPQRYRAETIVLPLIDNSIYTNLAQAVGGRPEPLDSLPVPKSNIFSVAVQLNKAHLLREFGLVSVLEGEEAKPAPAAKTTEPMSPALREAKAAANTMRKLSIAWMNYEAMHRRYPSYASFDDAGKKTGLSWRVHILPLIEQDELYKKFRLDEPWDSAHNRKLIAEMPPLYQPADAKLAAEHKTKIVAPVGEKLLSSNKPVHVDPRDVQWGPLTLVEADDEHAVVWTKPDDLEVDLQKPAVGLAVRPPGGFLVSGVNGNVQFLRSTIAADKLAKMMTRGDRGHVNLAPEDVVISMWELTYEPPPATRREPDERLRRLKIGEFLSQGIGNRIGLHVYDSEPAFDFSLPRLLGLSLGTFRGGGPGGQFMLMGGVLISALNSPIYVSVPVQDAKVVDEFLVRLDTFLAQAAREGFGNEAGMFGVSQDYYQLSSGDTVTRSYGFRFGPIKWRFFWARIGNGLYVASQPYILEDIAALQANPAAKPDAAREVVGHGMVRIRPQNWQRVLPGYQLGWAENNREACLNNVGPLSSLARAYSQGTAGKSPDRIHAGLVKLGERFYDSHFFCPDGGQYQLAPDGKSVTCSLHGTALTPRQRPTPAANSELGRLLRDFSDLTLTLTFLEDGLHAVATIDRQPQKTP